MKLQSPYRLPARPSDRATSARLRMRGPARGVMAFGGVSVLCLLCAAVQWDPSSAVLVGFAAISAALASGHLLELRRARRLLAERPDALLQPAAERGTVWEGWRVGSDLGL